VFDTLTPVDSLPSSQQITKAFNDSSSEALSNLQLLANPPASTIVDRGVQLRAVRALIHYCATTPCADADPAHVTLKNTELAYRDARAGSDLLVLRAALESLGLLKVPNDIGVLAFHLSHPSRDIRAGAARALRDLGNTNAIPLLRARMTIEQIAQVKTALSDALRVLQTPP
jgi:HEAT repeat protein